jgi:predicted nucleic acid-binding protein
VNSTPGEFLDTNVLVYAFTSDPRAERAQGLLARGCKRYGCAIFDALVVAAALRANCRILWSEDMHDGLVVDGRLRIANPFR